MDFTLRNHEVLMNYVGTPQWGPHENKFAKVKD